MPQYLDIQDTMKKSVLNIAHLKNILKVKMILDDICINREYHLLKLNPYDNTHVDMVHYRYF